MTKMKKFFVREKKARGKFGKTRTVHARTAEEAAIMGAFPRVKKGRFNVMKF